MDITSAFKYATQEALQKAFPNALVEVRYKNNEFFVEVVDEQGDDVPRDVIIEALEKMKKTADEQRLLKTVGETTDDTTWRALFFVLRDLQRRKTESTETSSEQPVGALKPK